MERKCKIHKYIRGKVLVNPWTNGKTTNPAQFKHGEGLWRCEHSYSLVTCLKCTECGHSYIPFIAYPDSEGD